MQLLQSYRHIRLYFSTKTKISIEGLFSSRMLHYQSTSTELSQLQFIQKCQNKSVYCGYDPTSDSLHLGNLVSIIMMSRLSLMGLKPLFLVGGATGLIGDPSGKIKQRSLLQQKIVQSNIQSLNTQISSVYKNIQNQLQKNRQLYNISNQELQMSLNNSFKMKNNYEFYKDMNAIRFLRDIGKYFRMGPLLGRETVANRLKSQDGISYAQFSYSIIQAYDFYKLNQEEKCILQFGGSDQWGNITNGCDLIRKKTGLQAYGITMPLLVTKTGQKFGKSQGNALFLNAEKTSSEAIFNYFLNCTDEEVEKYIRIFTFYPQEKINQILKQHQQNKLKKIAQNLLAESVLRLIRSKEENVSKNREFFTLSHQQLKKRDKPFFVELFSRMQRDSNQHYAITEFQTKQSQFFIDLIAKRQLTKSKSEARRQIQKGGLYINNKRVDLSDISKPLSQFLKQNLFFQEFMLIRWGKKRYQFIQIK